ncbi:unnamed protein product [Hymenolepis diminuta]|uniref:Chromo domain-containing protein n=1 Tax=Hymenolepis diminuta TaxID=6216 RepID=A0A0R3SJZ0_HYMDI|nr:unnamed protein product [Hymenolepis diminuta]VUZ55179.1 unnamed protein product [Hymenolepis diminuta]
MSNKNNEHEVEKVLDMRYGDNMKEYLIKWLNYSESDNSWEPEDHLNCPEKIEEFHKKRFRTSLHFDFSGRSQDQDSNSNQRGFDRKLPVEKIVGATKTRGEIIFLIKWQNCDHTDLIPAKEANKKCPQAVISFYEKRLAFDSLPF